MSRGRPRKSGSTVVDRTSEFVSLWTQWQPEVRRYVLTLVPLPTEADDVMQQTASRLWEKFGEYDRERPFVAWAIGFAYHEILSWRQRRARDRMVFSQGLLEQLHATATSEASLLELRRRALDGCLEKLSDAERELIVNRYREHGSVRREAERSDVRPHTLYHAIEKLRLRLLDCIDGTLRREGWQHG